MGRTMTTSPPTTPQEHTSSGEPRLGVAGRVAAWVVMIAAGLVVLALVAITIGPRFLPYQALIVRSGSMSPTIPTGSIVFYTKIESAKVKVGDVIAFSKPGDPTEKVTHRVYQIGHGATGEYFITKGDANGTVDDWRVPAVGTGWIARFHVPAIGYALVDLQSTLARLLLLVIPAILLGAITLYEIWQDRARGAAA
jgi:signal peptidase